MTARPRRSTVRIGGAAASIGDSLIALPPLLREGDLDYLVLDFLAEATIPMFVRERAQDPSAGWAQDFLRVYIDGPLREIRRQGIRIVTNAGGLNPHGCAEAVRKVAARDGLSLRIAVVEGDDLMPRLAELREAGTREMFSGAALPAGEISSANAYLGALPIAAALDAGADVVITGRVVDSALTLGPLIHEFGWAADDYDRLAAGTLAGHLLECGAQVTGGIFTDWQDVPGWAEIGYPIGECREDGSLVMTKPAGTGGLVCVGSVAEQMLYEIGDPRAYLVPDVTCDFSEVRLEQVGPDRVRVSGARGRPPTATYKAVLTYPDGWRASIAIPLRGPQAALKAERYAEETLRRTRLILRDRNMPDWSDTLVEVLGTEASYGARARFRDSREVICRIVAENPEPAAAGILHREAGTACMTMAPGHVGASFGRNVSQVVRVFLFLLHKDGVPATVTLDGVAVPCTVPTAGGFDPASIADRPAIPAPDAVPGPEVPLLALAWVRNGDKGNDSNVAVIARRADYLPYLAAALTPEAVARWYAHLFEEGTTPRVERYYLPGSSALNFLRDALGGGCASSLRFDPLGKSIAQEILDFPVPVSPSMAAVLERAAAE